jgi:hypothetical protein
MIKGPDYVNDDMDPEDDHSHGNFFEDLASAVLNC